jgi:hypothetical protein
MSMMSRSSGLWNDMTADTFVRAKPCWGLSTRIPYKVTAGLHA